MRLNISQKIIIPNILLMMLALGIHLFGHLSFEEQHQEILSTITRLEHIDGILRAINDGNEQLNTALVLKTDLQKGPGGDEFEIWSGYSQQNLQALQQLVSSDEEQYLYQVIAQEQELIRVARQALLAAYQSGSEQEIRQEQFAWSDAVGRKTGAILNFLAHNSSTLSQAIDASSEAHERINHLLIGALVLVLVAMSASFIYYRLLIVNPLQALKKQAEEFANGHFDNAYDTEIKVNDEIDDLRLTLNKMAAQLDATTVSRDKLISEIKNRKNIEKQLAKAQKMEAVGQLTGGIAHDFNNILGIASGNLELLGLSKELNDKNKNRVAKIERALTRASDLTDRLLRFSKNQNSDTQLVFINHLLDNLKLLVSRSFTVSIQVEFALEEALWPVELPAAEFEDAILNLALNAKDAMPEGGNLTFSTANIASVDVPDDVAAKIPGRNLVKVSVTDTGTGMSEEVLNRITEPFFSTKSTSKGSGLGLSMVYGFVSRAGGYMSVSSTLGEGSEFSLYFPASARQPENDPQMTDVSARSETPANLTVLVVDDEPELLEVTALRLNNLGYNTLTASDGLEAMSTLISGMKVDLLLSDIVMPGELNGLQLAKKVHERFPGLPVVLSSGYSQQLEQQEDAKDPYLANLLESKLAKPYTHEQLQRAMDEALHPLKT